MNNSHFYHNYLFIIITIILTNNYLFYKLISKSGYIVTNNF